MWLCDHYLPIVCVNTIYQLQIFHKMSISFSKEMIFTCSTHKIWSKSTGTYFQRVRNFATRNGGGGGGGT